MFSIDDRRPDDLPTLIRWRDWLAERVENGEQTLIEIAGGAGAELITETAALDESYADALDRWRRAERAYRAAVLACAERGAVECERTHWGVCRGD